VTCAAGGQFRWYAQGSDEVETFICPCEDQWVLHRYLSLAGIPLNYQRLGWRDGDLLSSAHVNVASDYMGDAKKNTSMGWGIIFTGSFGIGKTLTSILILKDLIAQGYEGMFATMSDMIEMYTSGWRDQDERIWFDRRVRNAKVLVLDDVGREYQGSNRHGLPETTFDSVLRYRVGSALPTIITTNRTEDKLAYGYGGAVMSLLSERSDIIETAGEDVRPQIRERQRREKKLGLTRPVVLS
jgi:DNA replication protein DnaC